MDRLRELSEKAKSKDIFLICYEGEERPCHRRLLLQIASEDLVAKVDPTPYVPPDGRTEHGVNDEQQMQLL